MTPNPNPYGAVPDGDEYEPIEDDQDEIDGEHPEGDYPPEIYDYDVDDSEPIPADAGCVEEEEG